MSSSLPPNPDLVTIQVGTTPLRGWQSVTITRSCESMPNAWTLTASAEFLQDPNALAAARPGQPCRISIGADLVISGRIDRTRSTPTPARSRSAAEASPAP